MAKPMNDMEGGFRLDRIRRIRNWLYSVQLMIIVVFVIALMYTSGDFGIVPFHLGVPSFLYFVLFMVIVLSIEGVIFVRLESRFLKSPSSKYYLLKKSIRRYVFVIVASAIIFLVFFLPFTDDAVGSISEEERQYSVTSSSVPVTIPFYSSDALGLTHLDFLSVSTDGDAIWVFIVTDEDYESYRSFGSETLASYRINADVFEAHPAMEYEVPSLDYGKYLICLYSPDDVAINATVTMSDEISNQMTSYVPMFCGAFIILNVVSILYLRPIMKLFEQRAIYR